MDVQADNFQAIGVDPDTNSRLRLKQATLAVTMFREVLLVSSANEAIAKLNNATHDYDIIFVSERLVEESRNNLLQQAKKTAHAQDAAVVLLVADNSGSNTKTAKQLLAGFDGFLMEPYSVDSLVEITSLAARVRKQRWDARQRAAIAFLVRDIIAHVDRLAYIAQCKANITNVLARLRKACDAFRTFDEAMLGYYFDIAAELFGESLPYGGISGMQNYQGASNRIKKRMLERILQEEEAKE